MRIIPQGIGAALGVGHAKSLRSQWLRGASLGVVMQGSGILLGFTVNVLLARLLGPSGLGEFSYALSIVAVLAVFSTLGLPVVVTRMIAAYGHEEKWELARGLLRWSNVVVAVVAVLMSIAVIVLGRYVLNRGAPALYVLAAPLVLILAWTNLRQRALQGLHKPIAAQLPEQICKYLGLIVVVTVFWVAGSGLVHSSEGVMGMWLVASTFSFICGVILLRRSTPLDMRKARLAYVPREWMSIALPLLLADASGIVFSNGGTIILGWLMPAEAVGHYQVALRLSMLILVLLGASNWVLAPWFSKLYTAGETKRLQALVTRTTRAIFLGAIGIYLIAVVWGKPLLALFFGKEFEASYMPFVILGVGQIINVASGPVVMLLSMTNGQGVLAAAVTLAALVSVAFCYAFISIYGMMGAAVAVSIATSLYNLGLAVIVKRRVGVGATIIGRNFAWI